MSAKGLEASGFKTICHVQGSPLPDVQKGDTSFPLSQDTTGQFRALGQLLDIKPGRQHICEASNSLEKDQAMLNLLPPKSREVNPKELFLALGATSCSGVRYIAAFGSGFGSLGDQEEV